MGDDESDLIVRFRAGDREAFRSLYATHAPRVKVYLLRKGFDESDAADSLQDVFVRVLTSIHTFDPSVGSFSRWLATIARNVVRRNLWRRHDPRNFDPALAEEILAAPDDPAADAAGRQQVDAVAECVAGLPTELRRIVGLRYVDGRSTRGIAELTELSEATVRLRLKEVYGLLESCLKEKGAWR